MSGRLWQRQVFPTRRTPASASAVAGRAEVGGGTINDGLTPSTRTPAFSLLTVNCGL
jgi:hypothetical protein